MHTLREEVGLASRDRGGGPWRFNQIVASIQLSHNPFAFVP